jgi:hypothetical protein
MNCGVVVWELTSGTGRSTSLGWEANTVIDVKNTINSTGRPGKYWVSITQDQKWGYSEMLKKRVECERDCRRWLDYINLLVGAALAPIGAGITTWYVISCLRSFRSGLREEIGRDETSIDARVYSCPPRGFLASRNLPALFCRFAKRLGQLKLGICRIQRWQFLYP